MKRLLTLVAALFLLAFSTADAASIFIGRPNPANLRAFGVYLVGSAAGGGANVNGQFDTVSLSIVPNQASPQFSALSSGVGKVAGDPFTFRNRMLDADPLDGGKGWNVLGGVTTAALVAFDGGPLGQKIDTSTEPGGKLFLANIFLPKAGPGLTSTFTATVQLFNSGAPVGGPLVSGGFLEDTPIFPEPATSLMAGISLLGLVAARRRLV